MPRLHETGYGRKLLEKDIPEISTYMKGIKNELRMANDLKARELKLKERELELKERELEIRFSEITNTTITI